MASPSDIVVIAKVVATRVDVDVASGAVRPDLRSRGFSPADQAALAIGAEFATHHGVPLRVLTVGTATDAPLLAEFAARVDAPAVLLVAAADEHLSGRISSETVAELLTRELTSEAIIVAGDHSLDRGSGSVPARVAEHLGVPQALGLLEVDGTRSEAWRRLSGGRRERLRLEPRGVVSVEAGAGRAPRASPSALVARRVTQVPVTVEIGPSPKYAPYRVPAARLPEPREPVAARRAMEVIGALTPVRAREVLVAEPSAAATAILDRLHAWGYR